MLLCCTFNWLKSILRHLSIIPAISVCLSVCLSATAVSRRPPVWSHWNLPGILPGTPGCAFSRFDIDRTSGSQVMAILLHFQCWKGVYMAAEGVVPPSHLIMPFFSQIINNPTTTGPIGLKLAGNIAGAPRMWLFEVWYQSDEWFPSYGHLSVDQWQDTVLWRHEWCHN